METACGGSGLSLCQGGYHNRVAYYFQGTANAGLPTTGDSRLGVHLGGRQWGGVQTKAHARGTVPGVIGMGAKDAVALLENAGLKVHLQGVGRVVSQSIQAGGPIRKGSTIFIKLE